MAIISKSNLKLQGVHEFILTDIDGKVISKKVYKNLLANAGMSEICKILGNLKSSNGINYGALGIGTSTPLASDTKLEDEGFRKEFGASSNDGNEIVISFYFNKTEAIGSWTEYGTFVNGNSSADSGYLFSHMLIDITKDSSNGLIINSTYALSDAT